MSMTLQDMLDQLTGLPEEVREETISEAVEATQHLRWIPNPGPQTEAYFTEADELFYGGQAGGGKSDLALGLALNEHHRALILRRTNKEAAGMVSRLVEIVGHTTGLNKQTGTWIIDGKSIELGGCEHEDDKQKRKGTPHDLKAFDEISDFTETQYTFIIGWNRSTKANQRCRIVCTGNPPTTPEGLWVLKRWGAWLDPKHPRPAQPGELRWYTTGEDGQELEVDGPGPHWIGGEEVLARSRTFIPSSLKDNPDLLATGYAATLAALPEEYRAAYRDGDFGTALRDDAFQTIPTAWVHAAQQRWQRVPPIGVPMCAMGVDVAQGGNDRTVLAPRHDGWFAPLIEVPGKLTPDGKTVGGLVVTHRRDGAKIIIDIGGGWGGDAYAHLRENGVDAVSYMGVKTSDRRTQDNTLKFTNVRTEAYWRFREALDPSQPQGSPIMLPVDSELLSDLCAPKYEITARGIAIESKEALVKRIGRSPDKGDAVVMAWYDGMKRINIAGGDWGKQRAPASTAVMSSRAQRRSRR